MADPTSEFMKSWEKSEQFYREIVQKEWWGWLGPLAQLVQELRRRGYDRDLRSGQSLYMFILSRSLRHGLRYEQPCLAMTPERDGTLVVEMRLTPHGGTPVEERMVLPRAECDERLLAWLERLKQEPSD